MLVIAAMKHARAAARKFRNAAHFARAHMPDYLPSGFFMTDPARVKDPEDIIPHLPPEIGVIVRHFGKLTEIDRAAKLAGLCLLAGRPCLIAADPELAASLGVDGVHWPARLGKAAYRYRGKFAIQTMSAHSLAEIRQARQTGMDAVIVSAVFSSESPTAQNPIGVSRLTAISGNAGLPVYGLGGISKANVEQTSLAAGFASVSGFEIYRNG